MNLVKEPDIEMPAVYADLVNGMNADIEEFRSKITLADALLILMSQRSCHLRRMGILNIILDLIGKEGNPFLREGIKRLKSESLSPQEEELLK